MLIVLRRALGYRARNNTNALFLLPICHTRLARFRNRLLNGHCGLVIILTMVVHCHPQLHRYLVGYMFLIH